MGLELGEVDRHFEWDERDGEEIDEQSLVDSQILYGSTWFRAGCNPIEIKIWH